MGNETSSRSSGSILVPYCHRGRSALSGRARRSVCVQNAIQIRPGRRATGSLDGELVDLALPWERRRIVIANGETSVVAKGKLRSTVLERKSDRALGCRRSDRLTVTSKSELASGRISR